MTLPLDIAILGTPDPAAARDFYSAALSPIVQDYGSFFRLSMHGAGDLGLTGSTDLAAGAGVSAKGSGFRGFIFSYALEQPGEVTAVIEAAAAAAGATITAAPAQQEWGGYIGHFTDPADVAWKIAAAE